MKGRIINIDIQGYKTVKNISLALNSLNVLIGANGAGKTNFISFLRAAKDIADCEEYSIDCDSARCIIEFEYEEKTHIYSLEIGRCREFSPQNSMESELAFKEFSRNWAFYQLHDTSQGANIKRYSNHGDYVNLFSDAGNVASVLYHVKTNYPKAYMHITEAVRSIIPYFEDFLLEREDDKIMLKWKEYDVGGYFNASQMSDGTLRAIALVTLLITPDIPQLVCIDEPELGLHPYAVGIMAHLIKAASARTQIILSTQSVELLNHFEVSDTIVVERRSGESIFRRLNTEEYQHWLEDYTLGDMWKYNIIGGKPSK